MHWILGWGPSLPWVRVGDGRQVYSNTTWVFYLLNVFRMPTISWYWGKTLYVTYLDYSAMHWILGWGSSPPWGRVGDGGQVSSNTTCVFYLLNVFRLPVISWSGEKTLLKITYLAYSAMYWILGWGPSPQWGRVASRRQMFSNTTWSVLFAEYILITICYLKFEKESAKKITYLDYSGFWAHFGFWGGVLAPTWGRVGDGRQMYSNITLSTICLIYSDYLPLFEVGERIC